MLSDSMTAAIEAAFGNANVTEVEALSGGRSGAAVVGFTRAGERFVVRNGEPRAVACMRIADELGVAPRLRYADDANGIAIMERVDGAPFGGCRDRATITRVAEALRRIHGGPAFPPSIETNAFFWMVNDMYRAKTGEELPLRLRELWRECAELTSPFPLAPCHRDLNPGNVLTTPDRVCILDWDTASAGDPFLDLSLLGVFGVVVPDDREYLLETYLGRAPDEIEAARFVVGSVHALAFYAVSFHWVAAASGQVRAAAPVAMTELRAHISDPIVVGASLLAESDRTRAQASFETAARSCAGSRSRSDASTRS